MAEPTATNSDRIRFFLNDDDHYMVGDFDGIRLSCR